MTSPAQPPQKNLHLLQIVGGQIWPNFLPILAWEPSKVTFFTSADPTGKYKKSIRDLVNALRMLGVDVEATQLSTQENYPSFADSRKTLTIRCPDEVNLINLTGGMKPMAMAAYELAKVKRIPSFYLDTRRQDSPWEDFYTAPLNTKFPSLSKIIPRITVRIALAAQGFPVPETFKQPVKSELEFAHEAAILRREWKDHIAIGEAVDVLRKRFHQKGKFLKGAKLRKALKVPISATSQSAWSCYLQAALRYQIITQGHCKNEFFLTSLNPDKAESGDLYSVAKHNFKLLEGLWFELAVLHWFGSQSHFTDVQWSVEADAQNSDSLGETDIVAFNSQTLNLHFISCKTVGPRNNVLEHIQGHRRRATKEGGEFSVAELWIFTPKNAQAREILQRHCEEQKVILRIFSEPQTLQTQ